MKILRGKSISPGYARGKSFIYGEVLRPHAPRYKIDPSRIPDEYARLHRALAWSRQELTDLQQRVLAELGQAESEIFRAHLALLSDENFTSKVKDRVSQDLVNVEHALHEEIEDLAKLLSDVENEYLRERASDVYDIRRRVLKNLGHGSERVLRSLPLDSVLVAQELLPSDTLNLDRSHVAAIVTEHGSETSHAAILARSLGIPGVTGVAGACSEIPPEADVLVDGESGTVTLTPEHAQVKVFTTGKHRYNHDSAEALSQRYLRCETLDGVSVSLMANIGRADEAPHVRQSALDGVGLYRTEYLFLDANEPPSLDVQTDAYASVADAMVGMPLAIRTLDLGGDKKPRFLLPRFENNPNLGFRGLRLSLIESGLFCTQLRAILRTGKQHENVSVLFPMVLGAGDLRSAIDHLKEVSQEEGCQENFSVGAMVETPSALFQLPAILELVDYISLGTNDLTQLMLAADRNAVEMMGTASVLHPSVLRAISAVVEAARECGKPVCVCGEAAGDPCVACLLVGLGIRQLSMSPVRGDRVRQAIRKHSVADLEDFAHVVLRCNSEDRTLSIVEERFGPTHKHISGA